MSDNYCELDNDLRTENDSIKNQIRNISISEMVKIFKDNKSEMEIDENSLNVPEGKNNEITSTSSQKESKKMFILSDCTNDTTIIRNKKRGRYTNSENEQKKLHDKFSLDNIKRKIQVHYQSFIINFINDILKSNGFKEQFLKLDYGFKKVINKQHIDNLKSKNIGEIVSNKISSKYKKEKNENSNLYKNFNKFEALGKIFDMNYLTFFRIYYMKKEKTIDLRKFGIEKEIILSKKTETYNELLEKQKNNKEYIKKIDECLKLNYLMEICI